MVSQMKFTVFELSNRGGRSKNEDRMSYTQTPESALFVLADGMGGHPNGEKAAEIAVRETLEIFHKEATPKLANPALFLSMVLRMAHHRIIRYGTKRGLMDVPRTTAVVGVIQRGMIWWAHCGDSRLYIIRDGKVRICTIDHSYAKAGRRTFHFDSGAQETVNRSMLYTCLGSATLPLIEVSGPLALQPQDRILLCSDGLWSAVDDGDICRVLSEEDDISKSGTALVDMALKKAGSTSDNVSIIGVQWEPKSSGDVARTWAGVSGGGADHLGLGRSLKIDEEINQSVNAINEALQRMTKPGS